MFGEEKIMTIEHELLKENNESLKKDNECLQERIKHAEKISEVIKLHFQKKVKEFEVTKIHLLEECEKERSEKEKYKTMFEVKKTKETETIDELEKKNKEILLAKQRMEEELDEMKKKCNELSDKLRVCEGECEYLRYNVEAAVSDILNVVMSEIEETDLRIGDRNQEEQCIEQTHQLRTELQEKQSPSMAVNHTTPFPASSCSSSSDN